MRIALALTASLLAAAAHAEGETAISFDAVPANVMDTALTTAPGVEFEKVSTEEENGATIYEFEATTFEGKHVEVDVREDGTLMEIEMEMDFDEVPDAVVETLLAAYPDFAETYVEASIRGDWSTVYEIEGDTRDGERVAVEISEVGEIITVSDEALS